MRGTFPKLLADARGVCGSGRYSMGHGVSLVSDRTRTHERDCDRGNAAVAMALRGRGFLCRILAGGQEALYARSWRALVASDVAALAD